MPLDEIKCTLKTFGTFSTPTFAGVGEPFDDRMQRDDRMQGSQFKINKQRKGHYSLFNLDGPAEAIHELERQHRLSDDIMRYMTIKVEEFDENPSPMMSRKNRRDD